MGTLTERLKAAFATLNCAGVIARGKFWCCQSCGCYAMSGIIEKRKAKGKEEKGYVFFHRQDNESRVAGSNFFLAYGGADLDAAAVGAMVVDALASHGVKTEWDGDIGRRIEVLQ